MIYILDSYSDQIDDRIHGRFNFISVLQARSSDASPPVRQLVGALVADKRRFLSASWSQVEIQQHRPALETVLFAGLPAKVEHLLADPVEPSELKEILMSERTERLRAELNDFASLPAVRRRADWSGAGSELHRKPPVERPRLARPPGRRRAGYAGHGQALSGRRSATRELLSGLLEPAPGREAKGAQCARSAGRPGRKPSRHAGSARQPDRRSTGGARCPSRPASRRRWEESSRLSPITNAATARRSPSPWVCQ